jgi:D-alanyl-D-alanine carboxypeptidase/D-alanyl-D-alanine-endopeptidase (penicillin-binding protein 4)
MKTLLPVLNALRSSALLLLLAGFPATSVAQERLTELAGDGSVVLHSPNGEVLTSLNPDASLLPASLVKIPLAQVALTTLGEDFRFETHFYTNENDDLLIRGLGDPFLVSEEVASIADILARQGLRQVRRLVMDDTAFEADLDLPVESNTEQPYGAINNALAVNFNTVNLDWTEDGELISGEQQTPLTPLAIELGAQLSPGVTQRINLGSDPRAGLLQVQQLFHYFLEASGITVSDPAFYREAVSDQWALYYRHSSSRSLRDSLDGLLRYSNNFIANQLFLTIGAQFNGYPATTDAARSALQRQLAELYGEDYGRDPQLLLMPEGSGLSRAQRSSGAGLMHILEVFRPYANLLPEINGVLRKSGTLTGVYNFAGYIQGSDGLYPFVILTNQAANNRAEILRLLQQRL